MESCYFMAGEESYLLKVRVGTMAELEQLVNTLSRLPGRRRHQDHDRVVDKVGGAASGTGPIRRKNEGVVRHTESHRRWKSSQRRRSAQATG